MKKGILLFIIFIISILTFTEAENFTRENIIKQLQKMLNHYVSRSTTPGAVLLVSSPKLGTIVLSSGLADKKNKIPMNPANNFRLMSMSKTFLAVLVLQLCEKGKLNLDDKIINLLPDSVDVKRIPNIKQVTLRQLLQMRSGIPDYTWDKEFVRITGKDRNYDWTPIRALRLVYNDKAEFSPNKTYDYSNTNYVLLQLIVEKVTHDTLASQMRKNIFVPLKMDNSYVEMQEERPYGYKGLITQGYRFLNGKLTNMTDWNRGFGLGDEAIVGNAADLVVFLKALFEDQTLLTPKSLKEMQIVSGEQHYGMGIYKEKFKKKWPWSHHGMGSGFTGQYYYFPQEKIIIIVLANLYDSSIIEDVMEKAFYIAIKAK